jgi:Na+(H+)/acetate symporter ActP
MPVPDSATLSGVLVALVAIVSFADLLATASGLNVTAIVHDAPAGRLAGQLFVCANQEA